MGCSASQPGLDVAEKEFTTLDANNDGKLSFDEVKALLGKGVI